MNDNRPLDFVELLDEAVQDHPARERFVEIAHAHSTHSLPMQVRRDGGRIRFFVDDGIEIISVVDFPVSMLLQT